MPEDRCDDPKYRGQMDLVTRMVHGTVKGVVYRGKNEVKVTAEVEDLRQIIAALEAAGWKKTNALSSIWTFQGSGTWTNPCSFNMDH